MLTAPLFEHLLFPSVEGFSSAANMIERQCAQCKLLRSNKVIQKLVTLDVHVIYNRTILCFLPSLLLKYFGLLIIEIGEYSISFLPETTCHHIVRLLPFAEGPSHITFAPGDLGVAKMNIIPKHFLDCYHHFPVF